MQHRVDLHALEHAHRHRHDGTMGKYADDRVRCVAVLLLQRAGRDALGSRHLGFISVARFNLDWIHQTAAQ